MITTELNIERLHNTLNIIESGGTRFRGIGITTCYLELMYAEAELGDEHNFYLYVAPNQHLASEMLMDFKKLIERRKHIDPALTEDPQEPYFSSFYRTRSNRIDINNKTFMFSSLDGLKNGDQLTGIRVDRVFFDISSDSISIERQLPLTQSLMFITKAMMPRHGDII